MTETTDIAAIRERATLAKTTRSYAVMDWETRRLQDLNIWEVGAIDDDVYAPRPR